MSKHDDYIPFGEEWKAEVKKWPKEMIIEQYRKMAIQRGELKAELSNLVEKWNSGDIGATDIEQAEIALKKAVS